MLELPPPPAQVGYAVAMITICASLYTFVFIYALQETARLVNIRTAVRDNKGKNYSNPSPPEQWLIVFLVLSMIFFGAIIFIGVGTTNTLIALQYLANWIWDNKISVFGSVLCSSILFWYGVLHNDLAMIIIGAGIIPAGSILAGILTGLHSKFPEQ